jgi:pimeloyl-ACP methyl ester carboxylesterase
MEARINDHSLYYELDGPEDGPALVLLHHGLGSTRAWRENVLELVRAGFRVIAYDRWGYGGSTTRSRLNIPAFDDDVEDLRALLDLLEIEQVDLIGHSDGGTISLHFAARFPERVRKLVLVAAHIYIEEKMIPGIESVRYTYDNEPRFRQGLNRVHGDKAASVFRNWYDGWVENAPPDWDMRPILRSITIPVLVVQGEQDEHATPQHAYDLASALPNAKLWLAPGAGHMLPQEQAEQFNCRVLEFLTTDA